MLPDHLLPEAVYKDLRNNPAALTETRAMAARALRTESLAQATALLDSAEKENRSMRASEQRSYDGILRDVENIDKSLEMISTAVQHNKADEARSGAERFVRPANSGGNAMSTQTTSDEVRAFARGETNALEVRLNQAEFRTLSRLSAAAGNNTVPVSFQSQLVEHLTNNARLLEAATVLTTTSGENLQIPTTTAVSTAAITAEAAVIAASDPAFGQVTLSSYKYGILMQASTELLEDSAIDVEGFLGRQAGVALGNALGGHLITGTGTGQPRGLSLDTTLGVTGATGTAGAFTADNLIDLYFSVIPSYRVSGTWLMNDTALAAVRKLKSTTNDYLFQPGLEAGVPDLLLGRPVLTDPGVATPGLASKSIFFGDLSRYYVRIAGGFRLERSEDFAFSSDLVTFRCLLRADGRLADTQGAVKHFIGAAT